MCVARRATASTPTTPSSPSLNTSPGTVRPRAAPTPRLCISASASCAPSCCKSFEPAISRGPRHGRRWPPITRSMASRSPPIHFCSRPSCARSGAFRDLSSPTWEPFERLYNVHHVAATPKDACLPGHPVRRRHAVLRLRSRCLSKSARRLRARRHRCRRRIWIGPFGRSFASSSHLAFSIIRSSIPRSNARVHRSQAHLALSLESARESMTLLKNDGHLLPLVEVDPAHRCDRTQRRRGALWRLRKANRTASASACSMAFARSFRKRSVTFDHGQRHCSRSRGSEAADVVILGLGEWQGISGEGFDRSNLDSAGQSGAAA